jgi:hypothetical protein
MLLAERLDARQPLGDRPISDLSTQQHRKLHIQRRRRLMIDSHMITLGLSCILPHPRESSRNHMVPAIVIGTGQTIYGLIAGGLSWTTNNRLPGRKPYTKTFRTGGPMQLSSRIGMSGAACVALYQCRLA